MTTIISKDLFNCALIQPLFSHELPNNLHIVSGYASHAMAAKHILEVRGKNKELNVDLVYGMAGSDGVNKINHVGFLSLTDKKEFDYNGTFSCYYVKKPLAVHSKVYVWCKGTTPVLAFVGSANYSEMGFCRTNRTETLVRCDPISAYNFFMTIKEKSILCSQVDLQHDFSTKLRTDVNPPVSSVISIETSENSPFRGCEKITLSLLTRDGTTGEYSRLNWGVNKDGERREESRKNGKSYFREPNQAYIGVPALYQRSGFFPELRYKFTIMTDDKHVFTCVRAQANGKAIETPHNNSELGIYFRERLGLPRDSYIDLSDLQRYGRTDVTFFKIDEENYVMDFSVPRES